MQTVNGLNEKLFLMALTYINDVEDDSIAHLEPVQKISKLEIRAFFEKKARTF